MSAGAPDLAGAPADEQARAVHAWLQRLRERHGDARLVETHASYVVIAGGQAYKVKKAVDLGFLDFRTLEQRRFFCGEELRLNRRTAPDLYVDVLPLTGTPAQPVLGGEGPVIDWVLHMRAFDEDGLWDRLAARGALGEREVDALVGALVALHRVAAVAAPDDPRGRAAAVRAPLVDSLDVLDRLADDDAQQAALRTLRDWQAGAFDALRETFDARAEGGFVRECHGDLHLGNVAEVDGRTLMFDCLEFSADLRFTDVMSDVAFMAMDLRSHGLPRLAARFVNAYAEAAADEDGLVVLRWYRVHRALVRAKVAALRVGQLRAAGDAAQRDAAARSLRHYLDVAIETTAAPSPVLLLTHGCSGSGKTALTQSLLELLGAIRIRADVQRKRLFGLAPLERSDAQLRERMYAAEAHEATYARLNAIGERLLRAGWPVILDATFLDAAHRRRALAMAAAVGVPAWIVDFRASRATLMARVAARERRADDPSEAGVDVLRSQLDHAAPLQPDELGRCVVVDAEPAFDAARVEELWAPLLRRLGRAAAAG